MSGPLLLVVTFVEIQKKIQREKKKKKKKGFLIMNSLENRCNTITIWIHLIKENKDYFTITFKNIENNSNIATK